VHKRSNLSSAQPAVAPALGNGLDGKAPLAAIDYDTRDGRGAQRRVKPPSLQARLLRPVTGKPSQRTCPYMAGELDGWEAIIRTLPPVTVD